MNKKTEFSDKKLLVLGDSVSSSEIIEIAKNYGQTLEDMKKNLGENEIAYISSQVLMDKLVEFLKKNNKIVQ